MGEPDELTAEVRTWLHEHPDPSPSELAAAGLVAPHWPRPWGLDASAAQQLGISAELDRADVEIPDNAIAIGWAGPTIVAGGTPEQQQRWLPGILDGTDTWTQLFSEPGAGSDLASLRTTALRHGDHYVLDGQKVWSTWAGGARWGILLARTDPDAGRHDGISYFVLDMTSPGVEIRPITEMTGGNHFDEVFFSGVEVPVGNRVGAEGDGWRLANVTLGNERVSLSEGGVLWGMGPTLEECLDEIRRRGAGSDPVGRRRAASAYSDGVVARLLTHQIVDAAMRGQDPSPFASIRKATTDANAQELLELIRDLGGAAGMLGVQDAEAERTDPWNWAHLFSRALTIGGGTSQVQRNIIGERILGLPREPRPPRS